MWLSRLVEVDADADGCREGTVDAQEDKINSENSAKRALARIFAKLTVIITYLGLSHKCTDVCGEWKKANNRKVESAVITCKC